jgi:hypothetical protein
MIVCPLIAVWVAIKKIFGSDGITDAQMRSFEKGLTITFSIIGGGCFILMIGLLLWFRVGIG